MHDAVANFFRIGKDAATAQLMKDPTIGDKDKQVVLDCYALGLTLIPEGTEREIHVETEVKLGFLTVKDGRLDWMAKATDGTGKVQGVLTDWKFGVSPVEDPKDNPQVWAYAAGTMKSERDAGRPMDTIEGVIAQPTSFRPDDRLRSHVFNYDELKGRVGEIKEVTAEARRPNPPAIAGNHCGFCPARHTCPDYKAMKEGREVVKKEEHAAELATVTAGTQIEVIPDGALQTPVVLISAEVVAKSESKLALAKEMTVVDAETFRTAGLMRQDISSLLNLIEEQRKTVKEPFFRFGQKIDAEAKKATEPLKQALERLDAEATKFQREEKRKADELEKKRLEEEANAKKAQEEAEAKRKEEEEAKAKAQELLDQAEATKGKKAKSAAQLQAQELLDQAEAARKERERIEKEQREADAKKAEELAATPAPVPTSTAGFRTKTVYKYTVPDFSKVPADLANQILLLDEKVVKALHSAKKIPPAAIKTEANPTGWLVIEEDLKTGGGK